MFMDANRNTNSLLMYRKTLKTENITTKKKEKVILFIDVINSGYSLIPQSFYKFFQSLKLSFPNMLNGGLYFHTILVKM